MNRLGLALALALPLALPATADAQVSIELGPMVSRYMPIGSFTPYEVTDISFPNSPSDLTAVAWGGQARLWFKRRIGVQLQGAVARRMIGGGVNTPAGWTSVPKEAQVVTVTAQVMYQPNAAIPLVLTGGLGTVRRGGDAYYISPQQQVTGFNSVGGAVGAGYDASLGHHLVATLGLTTYLYALNMHDGFGQKWEQGPQVDLMPYLAVAWRPRSRSARRG